MKNILFTVIVGVAACFISVGHADGGKYIVKNNFGVPECDQLVQKYNVCLKKLETKSPGNASSFYANIQTTMQQFEMLKSNGVALGTMCANNHSDHKKTNLYAEHGCEW